MPESGFMDKRGIPVFRGCLAYPKDTEKLSRRFSFFRPLCRLYSFVVMPLQVRLIRSVSTAYSPSRLTPLKPGKCWAGAQSCLSSFGSPPH